MMETGEMTEGLGDGGGGYGHSGGGPYRVPAARVPPGTTEGGAAERETVGRTEDLGGGGDTTLGRQKPPGWGQMSATQRRHWRKRRHGRASGLTWQNN